MINLRRSIMLALAFCLIASNWSSVQAQGVQYFQQTGHNLQGEFLKFYNAATDPTTLYGYPITEEVNGKDGKHVQYFQRARFELSFRKANA